MSTTVAPPFPDALESYRSAVEREIELSTFWGRYFSLGAPLLDIPNGFAHHARLKRLAPLVAVILLLARPVWTFLGMPLLAAAWALRWSTASGWGRRESVPTQVYLHASNDRNMQFVPTHAGRPQTAVTFPWRATRPPGAWATTHVGLQALSTRGTVWRAAWDSVRAAVSLWSSPRRHAVLFSYSAPSWFWTYRALRAAAPEAVWISNHVDRWASLATSLPGVSVTMVQHGDLGHLDAASGTRLVPTLTTPLPHVARVFITDDKSAADFVAAVTGRGPVFERITPALQLVPWPGSTGTVRRVLVVGHPDAQGPIGELIRAVDAQRPAAVMWAYRPHPTEAMPVVLPNVEAARVLVTTNAGEVPAADIVVSYGSSVTGEIVEATGAQLVSWDPNDAASVQRTVDALADLVRMQHDTPHPVRA